MSKTSLVCMALAFFVCCSTSQREVNRSAVSTSAIVQQVPFSLSVVPTWSGEKAAGITMAQREARQFYVVLTNVSNQPQVVWEWGNSWGYYIVWFEFTTDDWQKVIVTKGPQVFGKNTPGTFLVQPGEHQVYAIRLDDEWETHPKLRKVDQMHVRVKAIYEVSMTPQAAQFRVWTGHVESKIYDFALSHW